MFWAPKGAKAKGSELIDTVDIDTVKRYRSLPKISYPGTPASRIAHPSRLGLRPQWGFHNHYIAPSLTNPQISAQVGVTFSSHPMRWFKRVRPFRICLLYMLASHSSLRQFPREPTSHKPFDFYPSSTRSGHTIVFNQQHRWVAHRTPTPSEKKLPQWICLLSTYLGDKKICSRAAP